MTEDSTKRQVCLVMRVMTLRAGQKVAIPFGLYETKEDGQKAAEEASKAISDICRTAVVVKQRQTPGGQVVAEPLMTMLEFLSDLGIKDIGHMAAMNPVQGSIVVAAPKLIIPAVKH